MAGIYIIAGPNGAGKTAFAQHFLPSECREFVNADLIAKGLSPFAPEEVSVQAARLMLDRIRHLASQRIDFAFETTLSGRTYRPLLSSFKRELGYEIRLWFLWLPSAEIAVRRVRNRVRMGGHSIPEDVIRRRFSAGIRNLFTVYRDVVDAWYLYDTSGGFPSPIASQERGHLDIKSPGRYSEVQDSITREAQNE